MCTCRNPAISCEKVQLSAMSLLSNQSQRDTLMRWGWEAFVRAPRSSLLLNTPLWAPQQQCQGQCFRSAAPGQCEMPFLPGEAKALQDDVHLSSLQCAPEVSQFLLCRQTSQGIYLFRFPALSNRWADYKPLTLSHDQHICHFKPRLVSHWVILATSTLCITVLPV